MANQFTQMMDIMYAFSANVQCISDIRQCDRLICQTKKAVGNRLTLQRLIHSTPKLDKI